VGKIYGLDRPSCLHCIRRGGGMLLEEHDGENEKKNEWGKGKKPKIVSERGGGG